MIFLALVAILVFRYFCLPFGDQPDIDVTIPGYTSPELTNEIIKLSNDVPIVFPLNQIMRLVSGGFYDSSYSLPSASLYLVSSIPFFLLTLGILFLNKINNRLSDPLLRNSSLLILLIPSTSYYLISPKFEAYINLVSILFTYNYFLICYFHSNRLSSIATRLKILSPSLILFFLSLALLRLIENENQILISFFFALIASLLFILPPFRIFVHLPRKLTLSLRIRKRSLLTIMYVILFILILSSLSTYLSSIYALLSNQMSSNAIGNVAIHSKYYQDSIFKYPFVVRPIVLLSSFVFATAASYSVQIFTKIALLIHLANAFLGYIQKYLNSSSVNFTIVSASLVLIALALFPGYANYKYWIFLTPVFVMPTYFYPSRTPFYLLSLIYLELSFKYLCTFIY